MSVPTNEPRACVRCGCTDDRACEGGCGWVPGLTNVCTQCARPDELEPGFLGVLPCRARQHGAIEVHGDGRTAMGSISMPFEHPELGRFVATAPWALMEDGRVYVAAIRLDGLAPFSSRRDLREDDNRWIRERLEQAIAEARP